MSKNAKRGLNTVGNFEVAQLKRALSGGVILAPDQAREKLTGEVLSEVANIWITRKDIIRSMAQGLALAIMNGDFEPTPTAMKDLVASADTLARELQRRECEEVEEVLAVTGGSRTDGFKHLSRMLGVKPRTPEPSTALASQPTLIQSPAGA